MNKTITKLKTSVVASAMLAAFCAVPALAQTNLDYKANGGVNTTGTYTDLGTTGTAITVANNDDASSAATPIGFTFNFNGTNFTDFILNTNGFIKLGTTAISAPDVWEDMFNATDINLIAPLTGVDLQGATNQTTNPTEFRVATTGTAPNRVTTIQFENLSDKATVSGTTTTPSQFATLNFQIKLFEGTNNIEFVYGPWTATTNTASAQIFTIGLKGSSGNTNDRLGMGNLPATGTSLTPLPWAQTRFETTTTFNGQSFLPAFIGANALLPDPGRTFRFVKFAAPSNDLSVEAVYSLSKQSFATPVSNMIQVVVRNNSATAKSNIPVTLAVTGGTAYNPTPITIPTIAAGASVTVTFPNYAPAQAGSKTATATLPADDVAANNTKTATFSVTSNTVSYAIGNVPTSAVGYSAANSGRAFLSRFQAEGTNTLRVSQVRAYIFNDPNVVGKTLFAVVLDSTGTEIGRSANVVVTSGDLDAYYPFNITTGNPNVKNTAFYVGLAVPTYTGTTTFFPMAYQDELPARKKAYYSWAIGTTTKPVENVPAAGAPARRFMVEADLTDITGVKEAVNAKALTVYPNPSKGEFHVSLNDMKGSNFALEVRDMQGKVIYNGISGVNNTVIDLKDAAAGVYLLKVSSDSEVAIKRIVVE